MQHKNNWYLTLALGIVFFATLIYLGQYALKDVFGRQVSRNTLHSTNSYSEYAAVDLGEVKALNFQNSVSAPGLIRIASDGSFFIVATEAGEVLAFDQSGNLLWKKRLGLGKISCMEIADDNQSIAIGEESPEGNIMLIRSADGGVLWKHASKQELGSNIHTGEYPVPGSIAIAKQAIYIAVQRRIVGEDRSIQYLSRIYRYAAAGKVEVFPPEENMDTSISRIAAAKTGNVMVFGTSNWKPAVKLNYDQTIYAVQADLSGLRWQQVAEAKNPYQNTTLRDNPDISSDGICVAIMTGDGRALLYDAATGKLLWQRILSQPQEFQGVYLNAIGLQARNLGDKVIFILGNTHNRANYRLPTPVEDPNSNTVFIFDRTGSLIHKQRMGTIGTIEQIALSTKQIVLAIGRNIKTKQVESHGVYIISGVSGDKEMERLTMDGPCQGVAISPDEKYIAALESPLQMENGKIIGKYQVHLYKKR